LHAPNVRSIRECAKVAKHPTWQTANIWDIAHTENRIYASAYSLEIALLGVYEHYYTLLG